MAKRFPRGIGITLSLINQVSVTNLWAFYCHGNQNSIVSACICMHVWPVYGCAPSCVHRPVYHIHGSAHALKTLIDYTRPRRRIASVMNIKIGRWNINPFGTGIEARWNSSADSAAERPSKTRLICREASKIYDVWPISAQGTSLTVA